MQKKIIALAVASALAIPAAAMAEVTVYGQLNMAYEVVDNGDETTPTPVGTSDPSRNTVSSNKSRIGFKGTEDLGNGMTAMWQMEGQVNADTGTTTGAARLFNRNTFVGLSNEYGTVVWGNHDTPYKMSTRKLDVFNDTMADNRSIMGGVDNHNARWSDIAAYISPNFSGFSFAAAYVGQTDNGFGATGTTVISANSISGSYARDNYTVAVANQTMSQKDKANAAFDGDKTATKVAGSYNMDALTVGLIYEMVSNDVGGTKKETDNVYLSAKYMVSDAGAIKFGYATAGEGKVGGATNTGAGATQTSIGYSHMLTDNTSVYALYTTIDNDTNSNLGLSTEGSTAGFATTVAGGEDPNAVAIGMRMSF